MPALDGKDGVAPKRGRQAKTNSKHRLQLKFFEIECPRRVIGAIDEGRRLKTNTPLAEVGH